MTEPTEPAWYAYWLSIPPVAEPEPAPYEPWDADPLYFIALVILAMLICIVLPIVLTHGR